MTEYAVMKDAQTQKIMYLNTIRESHNLYSLLLQRSQRRPDTRLLEHSWYFRYDDNANLKS